MLGEKAITNRLNKYFQEHYGEYDLTANWHADDTIMRWRCDISQLGMTITLTCNPKTGEVTQTQEKMEALPFPAQTDWSSLYVKNIWNNAE